MRPREEVRQARRRQEKSLLSVWLILLLAGLHGECLRGAGSQQPRPGAEVAAVREAARSGDWDGALKQLLALRKRRPLVAEEMGFLGSVLRRRGRLAEAEGTLLKAIQSNPSLIAPYDELANLYREQGRHREALALLRRAAPAVPKNHPILLKLAEAEAEEGHFQEALRILDPYDSVHPGSEYLEVLARTYRRNGHLEEARSVYRRLLERSPDSARLHHILSELAWQEGDWQAAGRHIEEARESAPNSEGVLYDFARANLKLGKVGESIGALRRVLRMRPDFPPYLLALGSALTRTLELPEAQRHFERYLELRPESSRGHLLLGYVLYLLARFPPAQVHLERTLELDPTEVEALYYLALIAQRQGRNEEALQRVSELMEKAPHHAGGLILRGKLYLLSGDLNAALASLQEAIQNSPQQPDAHFQLSRVYSRLGKENLARRELAEYHRLRAEGEARYNPPAPAPPPR
ncbi:MAG: tetratricopeptide repeat protein [Acidobacteriota bacterium]